MRKILKSKFVINIGLMIFGLIMAFFVLEIAIRLSGIEIEADRKRMAFDNRLGHFMEGGGHWYRDFNNPKNGQVFIRSKNVNIKKSKGVKRILFIGDSGTYGSGVKFHEAFPDLLQTYYQNKNIEIINAAVPGFTTVNALFFLKHWLLQLKPDVVIYGMFMSNDINFNLVNYQQDIEKKFWPNVISFFRRNFALVNYMYFKILLIDSSKEQKFIENPEGSWHEPGIKTLQGLQMINYFEGEVALYLKQVDPIVDQAFAVTKYVLAEMSELAKVFGFNFYTVYIPTSSMIENKFVMLYEKNIEERIKSYNLKVEDLDFQRPIKRMDEICRELKIKCLNPTPNLSKIGLESLIPQDDHLSVAGHKIMADYLFQEIWQN